MKLYHFYQSVFLSGLVQSLSCNVRGPVVLSVSVYHCLHSFNVTKPIGNFISADPTPSPLCPQIFKASALWADWMSNIFRDSESLGKSNGNKWSQIWTFLFENCLKSPRKKKFFFFTFFGLLWFLVKRCFVSRMRDFFKYYVKGLICQDGFSFDL